eukprot:COSAG05_NODE_3167_length_2271_cov_2.125230_2_plen_87_part_00
MNTFKSIGRARADACSQVHSSDSSLLELEKVIRPTPAKVMEELKRGWGVAQPHGGGRQRGAWDVASSTETKGALLNQSDVQDSMRI